MTTKAKAKKPPLTGVALLKMRISAAQGILTGERSSSAKTIVTALNQVLLTYRKARANKLFGLIILGHLERLIADGKIKPDRSPKNPFTRLVKMFFPSKGNDRHNRYAGFLYFADRSGWKPGNLFSSYQAELEKRLKHGKAVTFDDLCREGSAMAQKEPKGSR